MFRLLNYITVCACTFFYLMNCLLFLGGLVTPLSGIILTGQDRTGSWELYLGSWLMYTWSYNAGGELAEHTSAALSFMAHVHCINFAVWNVIFILLFRCTVVPWMILVYAFSCRLVSVWGCCKAQPHWTGSCDHHHCSRGQNIFQNLSVSGQNYVVCVFLCVCVYVCLIATSPY